MTFNYREILPEEIDLSSRVWIYQSSRLFTISEALQIEEICMSLSVHGIHMAFP